MLFERNACIPHLIITREPDFKYIYDDYYFQIKLRLNNTHEIVRENILAVEENSKVSSYEKLTLTNAEERTYTPRSTINSMLGGNDTLMSLTNSLSRMAWKIITTFGELHFGLAPGVVHNSRSKNWIQM